MNTLIASRYEPLHVLGKGGMGIVYCVKDRLSNREMALKQVLVDPNQLHFHQSVTRSDQKLALAMEFRTLASLHHPHIVGVADYGFDTERQPYFTMEYLSDAQTIVEYATEQSNGEQLRLLAETLEALAYLHQLDVIHRDLKPENVLVNQAGQIKVADFGLAVASDYQAEDLGGTLAYMASEVFAEDKVSIQSDLFAVGVMAYEIFAGQHPYNTSSTTTLIDDILACQPDFSKINPEFEPFVRSLMAKSPDDRPTNAKDALAQLSSVSEKPIPIESQLIRESFLQHATFVGREEELDRLKDSLHSQSERSWLVGGESGVGKSRLLDELRVHALVDGQLVLRGYGVEENSLPYQLWRDIVRRLVLVVDVEDAEAGILKEIVPDIDNLLGRAIPDAPELTGTANQQRLTTTILNLFRQLQRPTVLLLEDLQWIGESLYILQRLNAIIDELSLVIIGSYRNDERADLPEELPSMQVLQLHRLSQDHIATLASTIIGSFDNPQKLTEELHQQTEGNVFFLVEVLRALAEQSGGLNKVPESDISTDILTSGIRDLLQRRINRISPEYLTFLNYVALAGRYLEMDLVSYLHQHNEMAFALDAWLQACSDAAIIEYMEEGWRFRHDKLRDTALEQLKDPTTLHQQVATALERVYPDSREARKFNHWHSGEQYERAMPYVVPAAEQFIKISNFSMAIEMVETALALPVALSPVTEVELYRLIGSSQRSMGQYDRALKSIEKGLSIANLHKLIRLSADLKHVESSVKSDQGLLNESEVLLLESQALLINNNIDASRLTAKITLSFGTLMMDRGFPQKAIPLFEEAATINRRIGSLFGLAICLENLGNVYAQLGNFEESYRTLNEALDINRQIGNLSSEAYCLTSLGINLTVEAKPSSALKYFIDSEEVARRIGDQFELCFALSQQGLVHVMLDDYETAEKCFQETLQIAYETDQISMVAYCLEMLAGVEIVNHEYAKADIYLQDALKTYDQMGGGFRANLTGCLSKRVHVYIQLGEHTKARDYYERLLQETPKDATEINTVHVVIGAIEIALLDENVLQAAEWHYLVKRYKDEINAVIQIPEYIDNHLSAMLNASEREVAEQLASETSITTEFLKLIE